MPGDHIGSTLRALATRFPGRLGHLFSTGGKWFTDTVGPYALDNGRFPAWSSGRSWRAADLFALYAAAGRAPASPRWALVPDVVADWPATMREWDTWAPALRSLGWPLALAVQDGATVDDVRAIAPDVVFVGGSTRWKWRTFARWCAAFPRVHVGRVNTAREGWRCHMAGAESIDGTGWMRTDRQRRGLVRLLDAMASGERPSAPTLFGCVETAA